MVGTIIISLGEKEKDKGEKDERNQLERRTYIHDAGLLKKIAAEGAAEMIVRPLGNASGEEYVCMCSLVRRIHTVVVAIAKAGQRVSILYIFFGLPGGGGGSVWLISFELFSSMQP